MAKENEKQENEKKRDEALVERLMRRVLEGMGSVVDRKLGREAETQTGFTTTKLIERMKRLIAERVRDDGQGRRVAPHLFKLKIEWGTHSEAPADYINDQRLRTLAPIKVETSADIFTSGIAVDPTFGEFEEEFKQKEEAARRSEELKDAVPKAQIAQPDIQVTARINALDNSSEKLLSFKPGGRRMNVGRVADNDLQLEHASVSKIHAALVMNREGTLLVADTGSTNGTFINGRRMSYGEARQIEDGDVVSFGDVEVRFKRSDK